MTALCRTMDTEEENKLKKGDLLCKMDLVRVLVQIFVSLESLSTDKADDCNESAPSTVLHPFYPSPPPPHLCEKHHLLYSVKPRVKLRQWSATTVYYLNT